MLCEKCDNIVFERLPNVADYLSEYVCYEHHNSQKALKASKDACHLCWKIWCAFEEKWNRQGWRNKRFEDSEPAPITFRMWLKDEWILDKNWEKYLDDEIFTVRCGDLPIITGFSNSMIG